MVGLVAAALVVAVAAAQIRALGLLRRRWFRRTLSVVSAALGLVAVVSVAQPLYTNLQAGRLQDELADGFGSDEHRLAYEECLRLGFDAAGCRIDEGDGLARIRIDAIGIDVIVVEGVGEGALRAGAGHYPTTAVPCAAGNAGIAGHRTTYGQPFHDVDRLEVGDEIVLETPVGSCRYVVSGYEVVRPSDVQVLDATPAGELTLTTCHPKGSSRQRLVVHATLTA
jgi:sortase A